MSLFRIFLWSSPLLLLALILKAQEESASPTKDLVPPPVERIAPVPAPEIPLGGDGIRAALPESLKINNRGGTIEGNFKDRIKLGGPIHVTGDSGLEIFSNTAELDLTAQSVTLLGDVSVYQGNTLQRGERAVYFYEKKQLDASDLRISMDSILLESGKFTSQVIGSEQVFVGKNAGVTTDDVEEPGFWIRSDTTTVYPNDRVTFDNLKLYMGSTPVFWLPYFSQPLHADLGYSFVPGARSNWGPFLLNTYGIMLGGERDPLTGEKKDAWLLSRWKFDLRATRGAAVGLDLLDTHQTYNEEITGFGLYYAQDLDPENSRIGIPRNSIDSNRYEIKLKTRNEFDWERDANWRFDTNLTYLSDKYYLEDFDQRTYRVNPAPDNTIGLYRRDDDSLLSIFGRLQVNDFYRTDTQSPEIALDQVLKPLFGGPIKHEGQTSFSIRSVEAADLTRRNILTPLLTNPILALPDSDPQASRLLRQLNGYERSLVEDIRALTAINPADPRIASLRAQLLDTGYNRFHTNHSFSAPITYQDWFSLTPHVGGAFTQYSSVQGPSNSDSRVTLHGGAEAALKFSRDYSEVRNRMLGLDGLLHVFQPYVNWSVSSADALDRDFPKIDRLTFTTRPRSLDPMRFTAIDEFESWNIVRMGGRQQLITHRDDQSYEWMYIDTYVDSYYDDPEEDRNYSNLYNDIRWQPLPWLGVDLETQLPVFNSGSGFSELSTRLRFMPSEDWQFSIAYRHLNNHPVLLDSGRIDLGTYIRLSENWGLGSRHIFEMDDGTIEIQEYTLQRDLGDWVAGVGLSHMDNRYQNEFGIIFSLTLKSFPSASLPLTLAPN
ncbi:MAG: assembly protein LptD [Verrucomicrobiota bacterium]